MEKRKGVYFLEVSNKECFVLANTPPPQTLLYGSDHMVHNDYLIKSFPEKTKT